MAKAGWLMIRYADDFVILCETQEEAQRALEVIREWTTKAGLILHPEKTRLVDLGINRNYIDFLGFRFQRHVDRRTGQGRFLRLVRPKSLAKLTEVVRGQTQRTNGRSLTEIIGRLNRSLRGWFMYFRSAHESIHRRMDQTIRRRLRAILAKRRGCPNWGGGQGQNRWLNSFFAGQGLFSLKEAHVQYVQSCRGTR
jgi:RNA-directed DNA polymerase